MGGIVGIRTHSDFARMHANIDRRSDDQAGNTEFEEDPSAITSTSAVVRRMLASG
jgi:hypothetical protein